MNPLVSAREIAMSDGEFERSTGENRYEWSLPSMVDDGRNYRENGRLVPEPDGWAILLRAVQP